MYINKELAMKMECCIKQTHMEVTRQYAHGQILELAGGAACFFGFDSYMSQVVAYGFTSKPKHFKEEIEKIEAFYKALNHPRVDIELCPYVGSALAEFLTQRGYLITEMNNVSALYLNTYNVVEQSCDAFLIREIHDNELEHWAKIVAFGFEYPKAQEQFYAYARAKGIKAFGAFLGDNLVAGATIALHGDFCDLGVTSTLQPYRGRGIQKMLLYARLNYARQCGLEWALVTTEPGTVSDLNVQKTGFHCAYTRIKLYRAL